MFRFNYFLRADGDAGAAGGGAPAGTAGDGKPAGKTEDGKTSAETGAQGKTAREIALEKKIATLEDDHNTLKGQLKAATDWIAEQTKAKAGDGAKKETVLDEVNSFLGCGLS
jgi:hypothetical protein